MIRVPNCDIQCNFDHLRKAANDTTDGKDYVAKFHSYANQRIHIISLHAYTHRYS
jgi:hypothetical protein